ncbi:hypothetical protein [Pseudoalteromonas luteoviolacea]|uniref:Phosphoribulokinase/uridine kinase domain-containing protein n=1 Tax=Pseudoalteromonas luteoviolacea S4054 TaxID=1129367 RepID=A0A0F6AHZ6_9GAMM|nr:hypothetical protein [Pseudoalteromonas luteoviolacea]AOT07931.1 hypothetical protein S4054249_08780 [Pseudoalteromonas luteoviolacea]AOT12847.1 hypothetical protein S40542_08780 [Pseudoalteromonas luteoviolacea]AOT17760.1 hypothetical protein S4054_08775 [Pseudoalteromonas luteoviolacea]KKE85827.1 hypothetical protein N479_00205 [Pseudoalteromonas luteoviolacea S4054]KZN74705.1 hypothetical protein N481_08585 [Pseudoalteromonas luteoviolacea S4047-1]
MGKVELWQQLFCEEHQLPIHYIYQSDKALSWFKKTTLEQPKPLCVAVSGCQGSGKSTLSAYFVAYLKSQGVLAESVSIDDFYYSKAKRLALSKQFSSPFSTRGAPGTHDIEQAIAVINYFKQGKTFVLPRFDKASDEPYPESKWTLVNSKLDVLVVEGWCLGLPQQSEAQLNESCNSFEAQIDPKNLYRSQVNTFLQTDYQRLFRLFDKLVFLNGQTFECVFRWRLEQEQKLIARCGKGMSEPQVEAFIQPFQRLTEWGIKVLPQICDLEIVLNKDREFCIK